MIGAPGNNMFSIDLVVRGHHIYKDIWTLYVGEKLLCQVESSNVHDVYAFAIKWEGNIVGHVPRAISTPSRLFLCKGDVITCEITGLRQFSRDLSQGGLDVV